MPFGKEKGKIMREMQSERKRLMFGTIDVSVEVHDGKKMPENELMLEMLTSYFGHLLVIDIPFYIKVSVYKGFFALEMSVLGIDGLKMFDYKNKKFTTAMRLMDIGIPALQQAGWVRISTNASKEFYSIIFVLPKD